MSFYSFPVIKEKGIPSWAKPHRFFGSWDSYFVNYLFWTYYSLITKSALAGAVGAGCGNVHR